MSETKPKHGEPWMQHNSYDGFDLIDDANGYPIAKFYGPDPKANERAIRTTACVNAIVGIPDPAEFVASARELLESAKHVLAVHEDIACSCKGCFAIRGSITRATLSFPSDNSGSTGGEK